MVKKKSKSKAKALTPSPIQMWDDKPVKAPKKPGDLSPMQYKVLVEQTSQWDRTKKDLFKAAGKPKKKK